MHLNFMISLNLLSKIMGEAKRRKDLGISPREKKIIDIKQQDRYFSFLPITKTTIKNYPYMGLVTMALGAIIFFVSGGF